VPSQIGLLGWGHSIVVVIIAIVIFVSSECIPAAACSLPITIGENFSSFGFSS
jgi:hypothetical protein